MSEFNSCMKRNMYFGATTNDQKWMRDSTSQLIQEGKLFRCLNCKSLNISDDSSKTADLLKKYIHTYILHMYSRTSLVPTNTVNANSRIRRTNTYTNQVPTMAIQLVLHRLIRTLDKEYRSRGPSGYLLTRFYCTYLGLFSR